MPVCTIVGAGPRIGSGLAKAFAGAGHDIVLVSREPENAVAEEVRARGVRVYQVAFDATDPKATVRGFEHIVAEISVPGIVVYNPANMIMAPFSEVNREQMEQTWPIMLYGAMNTAAAALPSMKSRGSGTLLLTGGGFGIDPSVPRAPHSIAKAALRNYAHGLFLELGEHGIHAGTVTVHRPIQEGDDMAQCAGTFLAMHNESGGEWSWERHYGK